MLDTLRLNFENIDIDRIKQHNSFRSLYNSEGTLVSQNATVYLNETIDENDKKLYNGTIRIDYSAERKYLNVGLSSAPVLLFGSSFKTLQRKDISPLAEQLQQHLNSFVDADITKATVSRLDNSTLYRMNAPVINYISLLNELSQAKQHHCSKKYFEGETIEFYNRQRTTGFYDKYAKNKQNELESKLIQTESITDNELRYEIQNKKSASIKKAFGLNKRLTLLDIDTDYIEEKLHRQRITEFEKHFKFQHTSKQFNSEDFINILQHMNKKHSRTAYFKTLEYMCIENGYITPEIIKAGLSASGYTRQAINKRMNSLKKIMQYDIDKTELYEELSQRIKVA